MRAVSEDAGAAKLMGINTNVTITVTFAIGSALAAVGAVLYSSTYPQVTPYMGSTAGPQGFRRRGAGRHRHHSRAPCWAASLIGIAESADQGL